MVAMTSFETVFTLEENIHFVVVGGEPQTTNDFDKSNSVGCLGIIVLTKI